MINRDKRIGISFSGSVQLPQREQVGRQWAGAGGAVSRIGEESEKRNGKADIGGGESVLGLGLLGQPLKLQQAYPTCGL